MIVDVLPLSTSGLDEVLGSPPPSEQFVYDVHTIRANSSALLYESSLIHWLLSWLARQDGRNRTLGISGATSADRALEIAAASPPGALLSLLPVGAIQGSSPKVVAAIRSKIFANQNSWPDLSVSRSAVLYCLDSSAAKLPKQFYPGAVDGASVHWPAAKGSIGALLRSVADVVPASGRAGFLIESLSTVIFELFKNTHDHARKTVGGSYIDGSVRGVYARYYPSHELMPLLDLIPSASRNSAERYAAGIAMDKRLPAAHEQDAQLPHGILELSVFDTGPGLANRWLGASSIDRSIDAELVAVMECFAKGGSSFPGAARGEGLWKVLQQLRELRGFIRLRTNRIHVCRQFQILRDYKIEHAIDGTERPRELLFDWKLGLTTRASAYPPMVGTLATVLVPI